MRRFIWPLLAALGMTGGLMVLGSPAPAPAAGGTRVLMVDNEPDLTRWHYDPAELTVPAGTTVVWFNKGKEDHTVTADDKSFDSGMKRTGGTYQRAFPKAGRFTYHCAPHPWMKGTVRVLAKATAAATSAGTGPVTAPGGKTETTAAPTATSLPSSLAPTRRAAVATTTSTPAAATPAPTPAPEETTTTTAPGTTEDASAISRGPRSRGGLAGTIAVVLLPTLAGLAVGAKLRQSTAHHKAEPA